MSEAIIRRVGLVPEPPVQRVRYALMRGKSTIHRTYHFVTWGMIRTRCGWMIDPIEDETFRGLPRRGGVRRCGRCF